MVAQPLMPFGEFRPDVADYMGQHSRDVLNVIPSGDGYRPIKSLGANSTALASRCMGMFYAVKNDGSVAIFAATSTKLYLLNNTNQLWTDVSKSGGTYTPPPTGTIWQFAQFNNFVIAVQQNTAPQVYDLTSSSAFADLGGSPPQASYITIVNRFVVLSGLASPNVYRVQWSGLNSVTTWDNINLQSNYQDLADGGLVTGVAGGEYGVIFQQRSIRRLTYQPGSAIIFEIDRISKDDGLTAPYSMINVASQVFFYSEQGFKVLQSGAVPVPIGKERVDKTFAADVDFSSLGLFIGSPDPQSQRVYWAYKSVNGTAGVFDTILIYDWVLDRWSKAGVMGEFLTPMATPGMTLEQVDAAFGNIGAGTVVSSVTISTAGTGDQWNIANTLVAGQGVNFTVSTTSTSVASLPTGYLVGSPYYVLASGLTTAHFKVSATGGVGALAGTAVSSTSSGLGTINYFVPSLENLTIGSLDSIGIAQLPALGAANSSHQLGFFSGPNLEATLESAEHGAGDRRIFVRGFRPITDAPGCFGSISERERQEDSVFFDNEQQVNAQGLIPQRVSTRYARGKLRIPAGTVWTFAAGVEPDVSEEGKR